MEEAGHPFHFDSQRERESRGWRWHSPVKESSEKAFTLRRDGMQEVASLPEHNGWNNDLCHNRISGINSWTRGPGFGTRIVGDAMGSKPGRDPR